MSTALLPNPSEIFSLFKEVSWHLDRVGIRHWMDFGTLLGAVREGGFLSTDVDVDFNFFEEDLSRLLKLENLFRSCWKFEMFFDPSVNVVRLLPQHPHLDLSSDTTSHRSCIDVGVPYIDLYPCRRDGIWLRHPVSLYDFPLIYSNQRQAIKFERWKFPAPQNARSLLRQRYGEGWRNPIPKSDFDRAPASFVDPFICPLSCLVLAPKQANNRDSHSFLTKFYQHAEYFERFVLEESVFNQASPKHFFREREVQIDVVHPLPETVEYSHVQQARCLFVTCLGPLASCEGRLGPTLWRDDSVLL